MAGQILLSGRVERGLGLVLLVCGAVAVGLGSATGLSDDREAGPWTPRERLVFLSVTALALFMRLYRLDSVPFAIFRDEARHGLLALRILTDPDYRPVFVGPPVSQPGPFFFALAAAFEAFGPSITSLRLVSALAGAGAVPLLWLLVRSVWGSRAAAGASFLLAVSSWHVSISRFAMPYTLPTLCALPALALLWRALARPAWRELALAGGLLGLAQYGAQTSRVVLLAAAGLLADGLATRARQRDWKALRVLTPGIAVAAFAGLLLLVPLLHSAANNPDAFVARTRQVAIWKDPRYVGMPLSAQLWSNLLKCAGAFNMDGDRNGRHHFPGAPFLDPVSGVLFAVGLVVACTGLRSRSNRFALVWLAAGLAPSLVTETAPNALRMIEAAPAVYALSALGAVRVWEAVFSFGVGASVRAVLVGLALATSLAYDAWTYFDRMYASPLVWSRSAPIAARLGETLTTLRKAGALDTRAIVYLPPPFFETSDDKDVLRFTIQDRYRLGIYDRNRRPDEFQPGRAALVLPNYRAFWQLVAAQDPGAQPAALRAAAVDARWRERLAAFVSGPAIVGPPFPASSEPTFWLYLKR